MQGWRILGDHWLGQWNLGNDDPRYSTREVRQQRVATDATDGRFVAPEWSAEAASEAIVPRPKLSSLP